MADSKSPTGRHGLMGKGCGFTGSFHLISLLINHATSEVVSMWQSPEAVTL